MFSSAKFVLFYEPIGHNSTGKRWIITKGNGQEACAASLTDWNSPWLKWHASATNTPLPHVHVLAKCRSFCMGPSRVRNALNTILGNYDHLEPAVPKPTKRAKAARKRKAESSRPAESWVADLASDLGLSGSHKQKHTPNPTPAPALMNSNALIAAAVAIDMEHKATASRHETRSGG
jgi:hypothetical protein